jgi:hypothetical protein
MKLKQEKTNLNGCFQLFELFFDEILSIHQLNYSYLGSLKRIIP